MPLFRVQGYGIKNDTSTVHGLSWLEEGIALSLVVFRVWGAGFRVWGLGLRVGSDGVDPCIIPLRSTSRTVCLFLHSL